MIIQYCCKYCSIPILVSMSKSEPPNIKYRYLPTINTHEFDHGGFCGFVKARIMEYIVMH